jgi:hypothetical protein
MKVIGKVERTLERWFRKYPGGSTREREPLEIRRAIVRELVDQVQPKGRGEFVFPYSALRIRVFANDEQRAHQLRTVLDLDSFGRELDEELTASRCTLTPIELEINLELGVESELAGNEYMIEYPSPRPDLPRIQMPRPRARLVVQSGSAIAPTLEIVSDRVLIGRMREVVESNTGRTRHNDLAFEDSETTVSRKHARISYDPGAGQFRLFDEPESREGTFIVRAGGQDIECDSRRGVRLRSGDEIRLGRVRILFEIVN